MVVLTFFIIIFAFHSVAFADTDDDKPIQSSRKNNTAEVLKNVNRLIKQEKNLRLEIQKKLEIKLEKIQTQCSAYVSDGKSPLNVYIVTRLSFTRIKRPQLEARKSCLPTYLSIFHNKNGEWRWQLVKLLVFFKRKWKCTDWLEKCTDSLWDS